MPRKRTLPPPSDLPTIFAVRAADLLEADKIERDAWKLFLKWCHHFPEGTRVELLRGGKVCAWLTVTGTRAGVAVQSRHVASPPMLA